jgi:hypothetical protein
MKLLTGSAGTQGKARALKMLAGGGVLVAALWLMSDPPPVDVELAAGREPSSDDAAPARAAPAFVPRKVAASVTNLFSGHSWFVAPPPPPVVEVAPPPPSAPPLPFTVLGSYASAGGEPVYFLVKGDSVYDVRIGDVIDNTYSVDSMSNGQLQLTYLPLKIGQTLPVGSAP